MQGSSKRSRRTRAFLVGLVVLALAGVAIGIASCGGSSKPSAGTTTKLPPGMTEADLAQAGVAPSSAGNTAAPSSASAQSQSGTGAQSSKPSAAADLAGLHFTVVNATRPTSNKAVISSSARQVKGDYLEVELTILNNGSTLGDLSQYSFRLLSPGIAADSYYDYYGDTGTYGKYVDTNEISASLLDYSTLQPVAYKVKVGEQITKVFLFFDLNPDNVAKNDGVTKDNTSLVIRKTSGTDYGTQVTIPLTGYPD